MTSMLKAVDQKTLRGWATGAGAVVLLYFALGILPGGRRAPIGVLVQSLYFGLLSALTAVAIVLIYRSVRIVNFSQLAIGGIGTMLFFSFLRRGWVPWGIAYSTGLILGAVVGAIFGVLMVTLFYRHPRMVLTVTTIVLGGFVSGLEFGFYAGLRAEDEIAQDLTITPPFADTKFLLDGFPFNVAHLICGFMAVAALAGLAVFLRRSRFGMAVRASAENADRASLLGINVKMIQLFVWTIAGVFSVLTLMGRAAVVVYQPGQGTDPLLLLAPLTAAVVARMAKLPTVVAVSIALTLVEEMVKWAYSNTSWLHIAMLGIILGTLLAQRTRAVARVVDSMSWKAVTEVRATPRELDRLRAIGWTRRGMFILMGIFLVAVPWLFDSGITAEVTNIMITAMIGLSLLILTGWTGQISLGQFALVAAGAVPAAVAMTTWGVSFWFTLPIAAVTGAGFAYLVGLPALRIRGLFLAVSTFSLAVVVPIVFWSEDLLGRFVPDQVAKPKLFFVNFDNPRWFYYLAFVFFAATVVVVRTLRRSRTGRILIAIRDDEAGVQSFGVNIAKTRLMAFALSGAVAGIAGALIAVQLTGVPQQVFGAQASIQVFIATVVGGLGTVSGPVLGQLTFALVTLVPQPWGGILFGSLPLIVLLFLPGGVAQMVFGVRDSILRVIAMRRHIVVPSLFADYSPEAWERRLAPLAPPLPNRGLAALPPDRRYSMRSRLFGREATSGKVSTAPAFLQLKGE